MKACRLLEEYSICIAEIRKELKETKDAEASVTKAVNTCINNGILRDFLIAHKAEVIGMFLTEYNEEEAKKCLREESYEEGFAEGIEKGIKEGFEMKLFPREVDVTPTAAVLLGVRIPAECEGSPAYTILSEEM